LFETGKQAPLVTTSSRGISNSRVAGVVLAGRGHCKWSVKGFGELSTFSMDELVVQHYFFSKALATRPLAVSGGKRAVSEGQQRNI
jgi:hypothetical protein